MKELINRHFSPIHKAMRVLQSTVPTEYVPKFMERKDPIFKTLDEITLSYPQFRKIIGAIVKEEVREILKKTQVISAEPLQKIEDALKILPELPNDLLTQDLLSGQELFQLEHDVAVPFSNLMSRRDIPNSYQNVYKLFNKYMQLRYRYQAAQLDNYTQLTLAYNILIKDFSAEAVIPAIEKAISSPFTFGNFELYEVRSAFRELVRIPSTQYAENFPVLSAIKEFTSKRTFRDKNTKKKVECAFNPDSPDPLVYMDKGDLYRMVRNLLRDAVIHGQDEVIRPVVRIYSSTECVNLSILSPGVLDEKVLQVIGKESYTTQDRGETPHGYGKVGARKLIEAHLRAVGMMSAQIQQLMTDHWTNIIYRGIPHVCWKAPFPTARYVKYPIL